MSKRAQPDPIADFRAVIGGGAITGVPALLDLLKQIVKTRLYSPERTIAGTEASDGLRQGHECRDKTVVRSGCNLH